MADKNASIYERLKQEYKEDLRTVNLTPMGNESIPQYLGQLMGESEWRESDTEANKKFIHVDAYERFTENDCLVLVGRTGTGKTSLLKKLEFDVKNKRISNYKDVVFINLQEYIRQLTSYASIDGTVKTYAELESNLSNFIILSIMKHVIYETPSLYPSTELHEIKSYLDSCEIKRSTNLSTILASYADRLTNEHINTALNTVNLLTELSRHIFGVKFETAKDALNKLFKFSKMLVLVDTLEYYDFNDTASIVIVKSLLKCTFTWFTMGEMMCIKISLPSELYSILREQIPAKQIGNTVFIEWKYKDLVKFIAKRCYYLFTQSRWANAFHELHVENSSFNLLSSDYNASKELLLSFLPSTCSAMINLSFDTLSYIIRHTQKKPRQLMIIFEAIIHKMIQKQNPRYYFSNQEELKDQIHYVQTSLICDCLNMYANTYDSIVDICSMILGNRKYSISNDELNEFINRSKTELETVKISRNDIKRVLIQSGILGIYTDDDVHYIDKDNTYFKNPNIIKIIPVKYEYQIKGRLPYNEKSIYVIHPMCYEHYRTEIDYNCLIYPECDDETDETFTYFMKSKDLD